MATIASTNVTRTFAPDNVVPILWGGNDGLIIEVFRVASGAAQTDTVAITPRFTANIVGVQSNVSVSDNLSTTAANTNVTLTLGMVGTAATATIGAFQVYLIGQRSTV